MGGATDAAVGVGGGALTELTALTAEAAEAEAEAEAGVAIGFHLSGTGKPSKGLPSKNTPAAEQKQSMAEQIMR